MNNVIELAKKSGFTESSGNVYGSHKELETLVALIRSEVLESVASYCDMRADGWDKVNKSRNVIDAAMCRSAKGESRALAGYCRCMK